MDILWHSLCVLKIFHCVTIGVHTVEASQCVNDESPNIDLSICDEQPAPQTEQGIP